ncbi:unnamed protein product [Sphenostylis stenocarpa]|uniref:Uncharacterized protein n=1 Tax=Sphenostylis stenocarpa TaxID=92480 RepID=A0AA86TAT3_9FABA|nr:unnamed protein product [Sphenostylis stenocarpa]
MLQIEYRITDLYYGWGVKEKERLIVEKGKHDFEFLVGGLSGSLSALNLTPECDTTWNRTVYIGSDLYTADAE